MTTPILLIAGPTASGKTALALELAQALGAEIVNADALQVYADLSILSARPCEDDVRRAPHHLFGHVDADERYSVGRWLRDAESALAGIAARGAPAIVVGGTGLYFKALTLGLADAPAIDPEAAARAHALRGDLAALRAEAERLDPVGAARVNGDDGQRLERLVAVALTAGRPLSALQADTAPRLAREAWRGLVIEPDRAALYARIDARAQTMIAAGALDEAGRLLDRGLDPALPAMKAIGVQAEAARRAGELDEAGVCERLARETRNFAKRQLTWFRNQTPLWPRLSRACSPRPFSPGALIDEALAVWRAPPFAD